MLYQGPVDIQTHVDESVFRLVIARVHDLFENLPVERPDGKCADLWIVCTQKTTHIGNEYLSAVNCSRILLTAYERENHLTEATYIKEWVHGWDMMLVRIYTTFSWYIIKDLVEADGLHTCLLKLQLKRRDPNHLTFVFYHTNARHITSPKNAQSKKNESYKCPVNQRYAKWQPY